MKKVLVLTTAVLLFILCKKEKPAVKPNVDLFFAVYETLTDLQSADSSGVLDRSALLDSALKRCGMSPEQFDTTLSYLAAHPQILVERLEAMEKKKTASLPEN
ncbi:MAG: hypothetical protein ONB12_04855 [candidate division KSB1 bacterium]|nr:hypothetical protein [candidate division KSB1 bacterium]